MAIETISELMGALRGGAHVLEKGNARLGHIKHRYDGDENRVITRGPRKRWDEAEQRDRIVMETTAIREPADFRDDIRESLDHDGITLEVEDRDG